MTTITSTGLTHNLVFSEVKLPFDDIVTPGAQEMKLDVSQLSSLTHSIVFVGLELSSVLVLGSLLLSVSRPKGVH